MQFVEKPPIRQEEDVLGPGHSYGSISDKIGGIVLEQKIRIPWLVGLLAAGGLFFVYLLSIGYLFYQSTGIWGLNVPVAWGFAIISFVWWIGIGHAGTLISAILFLLRQEWRMSIARFAEAMTLFAVACAGVLPIFHSGRPWLTAYWLFPYPNTFGLWPQFRSPLIWDVFAVLTYATVSVMFWYVGLIPDLASLRDKAQHKLLKIIYGMAALGWRGSAVHWDRYNTAYLLLAALATPLVVSVHSVVSFDFATSLVPGWHTTIFPPYFVAGAIFAGFAMVMTLTIPLRILYGLKDMITAKHLDNMAKVTLATGLIVAYGYLVELFIGWYSASDFEIYMLNNRFTGPYAAEYWTLIFCNVVVTQLLWFRWVRYNPWLLWFISLFIGVGMWLERFVIVVMSLHRDFMPSSWDMYYGTAWDWSLYIGSLGFFLVMILIFIRSLPMISIVEMKELLHKKSHQGHVHE